MKITFLSQRQIATIVSFGLSMLIEILLMKITPNNLETTVFLISSLSLFYLSIEISQNFTTNPIMLDIRSKEIKNLEEANRTKNLIEGFRNNLLALVAEDKLSLETAERRYFSVKKFEEDTNPLLLEEKKQLEWKEELHQQLKIGNY